MYIQYGEAKPISWQIEAQMISTKPIKTNLETSIFWNTEKKRGYWNYLKLVYEMQPMQIQELNMIYGNMIWFDMESMF